MLLFNTESVLDIITLVNSLNFISVGGKSIVLDAIYTESDPRAILLKEKARELSVQKGTEKDFALYENIEKLTKEIFKEQKGEEAIIAANVDLYSGFVYRMLDIPTEIFTPLFAIARMGGWCAHRIEQILSDVKIIRPAYRSVAEKVEYIPLEKR